MFSSSEEQDPSLKIIEYFGSTIVAMTSTVAVSGIVLALSNSGHVEVIMATLGVSAIPIGAGISIVSPFAISEQDDPVAVVIKEDGTLNNKPYNKVDYMADKIYGEIAPKSEQKEGTIIIKGKETKEVFDEICKLCGTKENLLVALDAISKLQQTNTPKKRVLTKEENNNK